MKNLPPDAVAAETLVYGRADGLDLRAERYFPRRQASHVGKAVAMVHGGAWTANDRHTPEVICRQLAGAGFSVFSLDFRDGRNGRHPCAVQDIAAAIRYVRTRADALGIDAERIGLIGSSSGGHLALLSAIQPDIPAHRGTPVLIDGEERDAAEVSASVCCVAALWPVSDPLLRYRYAIDAERDELVAAHRRYYRDEAHMRQASVQRILQAGEAEALPPLLLVQPGEDANVPRQMTLALVREYQDAGGELRYLFYPGLPHAFAYQASPETTRLGEEIQTFFASRLGDGA